MKEADLRCKRTSIVTAPKFPRRPTRRRSWVVSLRHRSGTTPRTHPRWRRRCSRQGRRNAERTELKLLAAAN